MLSIRPTLPTQVPPPCAVRNIAAQPNRSIRSARGSAFWKTGLRLRFRFWEDCCGCFSKRLFPGYTLLKTFGGMSAGVQTRSAVKGPRSQSLFYRDLSASPATRASNVRGDATTPNPAATALWRDNVGGIDPPPPPFYTLEDRIERSPESTTDLLFRSPDSKYPLSKDPSFRTVHSPPGGRGGYGLPYGDGQGSQASPATPARISPGTKSWWSPVKERGGFESGFKADTPDKDGCSPVSGVVQQPQSGVLLTLPAPREIVRPGFQGNGVYGKGSDGEEWVTVFGFGVDETNAVMREFEKCGPILNQVSGPGGANWVHIQYQNPYDAQKALQKNGIQLNGALIVGVKPLDALQRQALIEKIQRGGQQFMTQVPRQTSRVYGTPVKPSSWSQPSQPADSGPASRSVAAIASPAKSTLSKLVDIVFGM
ncbi:hypothetical protein R1flu_020000 [Riccia fluitans]|uniref:RRM Nup35-type domain-containing protein n=1 Tax=Riccia fluitans TaxID=41844 RepID=A0ABD1ZK88_9MARC